MNFDDMSSEEARIEKEFGPKPHSLKPFKPSILHLLNLGYIVMRIVFQHHRLYQGMGCLRYCDFLVLPASNLLILYLVIYYLQGQLWNPPVRGAGYEPSVCVTEEPRDSTPSKQWGPVGKPTTWRWWDRFTPSIHGLTSLMQRERCSFTIASTSTTYSIHRRDRAWVIV